VNKVVVEVLQLTWDRMPLCSAHRRIGRMIRHHTSIRSVGINTEHRTNCWRGWYLLVLLYFIRS